MGEGQSAVSRDAFAEASYGARALGFGRRPAILVVDFQRAFTDSAFPMGRSAHVQRAVDETAALLAFARPLGIPVATCAVGWCSEKDMGRWKVDAVYDGLFYGQPGMELDPRIAGAGDFHFTKGAPSMFFGTPLVTFLTREAVDTVLVTGCTTSGCVRATVNDAFSYGYRVIVPEACCGDQDQEAHEANLRDVGRRYADVMTVADTRAALAALETRQPETR
ncbi:isochorismatase family protein [Pseudohaliea rubra]|uniref:N-carbamoylsarcosine amidase n=1 Tax=Pseudohaliea rubra DSM 19751 TaxID=1265313 RepID=A0A095X0V7_9GAMM|nr:isochorismatase family protein [Pseudohaliea rubra]KGE04524.1 N-carbamoylsarcosine amidase [Pseudohaliea rubra DSM 19751]